MAFGVFRQRERLTLLCAQTRESLLESAGSIARISPTFGACWAKSGRTRPSCRCRLRLAKTAHDLAMVPCWDRSEWYDSRPHFHSADMYSRKVGRGDEILQDSRTGLRTDAPKLDPTLARQLLPGAIIEQESRVAHHIRPNLARLGPNRGYVCRIWQTVVQRSEFGYIRLILDSFYQILARVGQHRRPIQVCSCEIALESVVLNLEISSDPLPTGRCDTKHRSRDFGVSVVPLRGERRSTKIRVQHRC